MNISEGGKIMLNQNIKSILKTAAVVIVIYVIAVGCSLFLCDRVNELESREDVVRQNASIVLQLK